MKTAHRRLGAGAARCLGRAAGVSTRNKTPDTSAGGGAIGTPFRVLAPAALFDPARRVYPSEGAVLVLVTLTLLLGCSHRPLGTPIPRRADAPIAAAPEPALTELLEGVRLDPARHLVEFDATVAVDCRDPETPDVYLEVVCCTPDTREHEALVVTSVPPSSVHAALLAVGGSPGSPGAWRREGDTIVPVPPSGDRVRVTFLTNGPVGQLEVHDPAAWIIQRDSGLALREVMPATGWVFAGSRIRRSGGLDVYDADGTGQLIGLHTFGSETVGWTSIESPEAAVDAPQWLTNNALVPPVGTPVRVRLEIVADK